MASESETPDDDMEGELRPSVLGTREYWEDCYSRELLNFKDHGDEGEVWFGSGIVKRLLSWICDNLFDQTVPVLDIGCGNGMLLLQLHRKGYKNLVGVDYSKKAIELAKSVASKEAQSTDNLRFKTLNFLTSSPKSLTTLIGSKYQLILDKGTFDAISLDPNGNCGDNRSRYCRNLEECLEEKGLFMITSCNWTREELEGHFLSIEGSGLTFFHEIQTPSIAFGGKKGNQVTCLIFQKKPK